MSTDDAVGELRLASTVRPATEKILSDGALVAGTTTKLFTYSTKIFKKKIVRDLNITAIRHWRRADKKSAVAAARRYRCKLLYTVQKK